MTNEQALSSNLWPRPVPLAQLRRRVPTAAALALGAQHVHLRVAATLGLLVSSIPVAYAFSRLRWRGRDAVFLFVLVALMLPPQVTVVPLYVMWAKLHLVGIALAAYHPELVRRRVRDLPAPPVLPDHPAGVPRRGARGRLRRVAHPHDRRRCGWRSRPSRRSRSSRSSTPSTTSSCRCSTWARTRTLGALDRVVAVPLAPPGAVEPDDGRHAARDGARDRRSSSSPSGPSSRA